ncbi:hypothetical protein A5761_15190 [Mycolicibacterium setense]|uniref:hypothetical protein n=1 Tax=Mycolicibacterium setense TaxID=431269 RepID=UPI0007E9B2E2|nr:hypothetical protein [Mycolicibacterium setense]OBB15081.1 hypothetical protein A5761_15190 [Mycolicibacterium setense]
MSKKPRQSRHRVPTLTVAPDEITPEYQAEIDMSMEKLARRYEKAQKALQAAEAKAERARLRAEELEQKQVAAAELAERRAEEESRANGYVQRIKLAAKESRIESARAEATRKHAEAVARRNAITEQRKAEARATREREQLIARSRSSFAQLESDVAERRRELREIERLMMPGNYAGRSHRGTGQPHHNSGRTS